MPWTPKRRLPARSRLLSALLPALLAWSALGAAASAQSTLVDWDFSSLVPPGAAGAPLAVPLLDPAEANASSEVTSTGLTGERALPSYQGLLWANTNPAPGELNLRYFDGDLSDPAGTNHDGVNDNYLSFTLTPTGAPVEVSRISVSAWRNGSGAPETYAMEVVVDGQAPTPFGSQQRDTAHSDGVFDWFHFDDSVTASTSLEIRFRPVASPGGQGTGNLHIDGLKVQSGSSPPPATGPNVLFLIADDLTANALACYGNTLVHTPNIDALASRGMRFERAYSQYPVCNASRSSILSGLYPDRIKAVGGSYTAFDAALGAESTLPEHFRLNGYTSSRVSKIYHMRVPGDITSGSPGPDHGDSWDTTYNVLAPEWMSPGVTGHYTNETLIFDPHQHYNLGFGAAFYKVETYSDGSEQADALAATEAVQLLNNLQDDSFFLAVGFVRPHVPLVAPATTFAQYNAATLPLAASVPNDLLDIPSQGIFWDEPVRGPNNDDDRRSVLQAYYASVTFMDEQVGRVVTALENLGLGDDTIIVFTSDHGYHLGEHTMWQKLSLHEESARVPLIIAGPGIAPGTTGGLAELIDLYPTLADLADLPVPPTCQGESLRPLLEGTAASVREAALTSVDDGDLLRTEEWAYIRYSGGGEELYPMMVDPISDPLQFTNLASDPAHQVTRQQLETLLDAKLDQAAADPAQGPACGFLPYGVGLSTVNHIALEGTGNPSVGGTIQLNSSGAAGSYTMFVGSHAQTKEPLVGGTLLVERSSSNLTVNIGNTGGSSSWSLNIPADPALAGREFYFQSASPNPALPSGWGLSNGVRMRICP